MKPLDEVLIPASDLVTIARLALTSRQQDIHLFLRRLAKRYSDKFPGLSEQLKELVREAPTRSTPLRKESMPAIPLDLDSRMQLLRVETSPDVTAEPIYPQDVRERLDQLVKEQKQRHKLEAAGLSPTRTVLFTGAPGVGKTLAARWIASQLQLPLLILDLSAVMSSFLGRTGINIRNVMDYAKSAACVLLLDELDTVAKRRDDESEIGELKRLVTVLLQELDDWPSEALLLGATNHAGLLDPAVWRRFENWIEFPMPEEDAVAQAVDLYLETNDLEKIWRDALVQIFRGKSFSAIESEIMSIRRAAAVSEEPLSKHAARLIKRLVVDLPAKQRKVMALDLIERANLSQRLAHELTGVSRDTIRKCSKPEN